MEKYHCFLFAAAVLGCGLLAQPRDCQALGESGPWYLRLSSSARANGMGESLVAVADPALTVLNPAALGLYSLNHLGAVGYSFHRFNSDVYYRYFYANLGLDLRTLKPGLLYNLSLGLQYRSQVMDYGEVEGRDENNNPIGPWETWEGNRALVASLGFEYGFEVGLGISTGSLDGSFHESVGASQMVLSPSGNPQDWGLMLRLPIFKMAEKFHWRQAPGSEASWRCEITPSLGFASLHQGDGVTYDPSQPEYPDVPFPQQKRYGAALDLRLGYQKYDILSILLAFSKTRHDVEESGDGSERLKETGWGAELSFLDVLQIRTGWHLTNASGYANSWPLNYYFVPYAEKNRSLGISLQTDGITRYIYYSRLSERHSEGSLLAAILTRASFKFSIAWWDYANRGLYDYRWFEFGLSF